MAYIYIIQPVNLTVNIYNKIMWDNKLIKDNVG